MRRRTVKAETVGEHTEATFVVPKRSEAGFSESTVAKSIKEFTQFNNQQQATTVKLSEG